MPLITKSGLEEIELRIFHEFDTITEDMECCLAVDIPNDIDAYKIVPLFNQISLIRIPFPSAADGRGYSIARRLRNLGYEGVLRAKGHVISDQYSAVFLCGFDEIEPDEALYDRQSTDKWQSNTLSSYRNKLRNSQVGSPA